MFIGEPVILFRLMGNQLKPPWHLQIFERQSQRQRDRILMQVQEVEHGNVPTLLSTNQGGTPLPALEDHIIV